MRTLLVPSAVLCLLAGCSGNAPTEPVSSDPVGPMPVQPVFSSPRHHPTVDVDRWCAFFSSALAKANVREGFYSPWRFNGTSVCGPMDVARVELVRKRVMSRLDVGRRVPVDLFVWSQGEPEKPYLTKVGGVPHRERSAPWPKAKDGTPCTFVAQWCFLDSLDIVPGKLKGDVLLLFLKGQDDWSEDSEIHLEWSARDLKVPARAADCPKPSFAVSCMAGQIWRTFEYPDSEEVFEKEGCSGAYFLGTTQATKIGRVTWFIQDDVRRPGEELLCTLDSFQVREPWPYCNVEVLSKDGKPLRHADREAHELMFGDLGCLYVLIDKNGNVRCVGDCY